MKTETKTKKTILMRATMMLLVMLLTAATAWAAKPSSCLDLCYGVKYGIHVQGWTYDPDASATSLDVHVYVYTDAGCTSRYGDIQVLTANVSRPDVNEAKGITGNHGFNADIAIADVGTYWVKVFAIDTGSDGNPQIGSTTQVTVTTNNVVIHSLTGAVTLEDGDVLSGTGGTDTHVTIADGATVTLSGVTIIAVSDDYQNNHPGITCAGNATIILAEGTTNNIQGGTQYAGIFVPLYRALTISGSGSMTVTGGLQGAGIGCNYGSNCGDISIMGGTITATGGATAAGIGGSGGKSNCGNIVISGGTVTAWGGNHAAGIGCGASDSSCGSITITDDVVSLTAVRGSSNSHAIGLGANSSKSSIGSVTIGGMEMTNVPQSQIVYCPAETSTNYTVHFDKNNDNVSGTMTDQVLTSNTPQALTPCGFIYDDYHDFVGWNTAANGKGYNLNDEQAVINLGDITLYAKWKATDYSITYVNAEDGIDCVTNTNPKTYNVESNEIILTEPVRVGFTFDGWTYEGQDEPIKTVTIPQGSHGAKIFTAHWTFSPTATITTSTRDAYIYDGQTLTGTGGKDTHVTIADGATVTLSGVTITSITANSTHRWAGITCEADATIILSGENAVTGGYCSSGIFVPEGKTLVIQGDGSLNATGGDYAAGIGSGHGGSCGNIIIDGGTVMATGGGDGSAGIGSGKDGSCGNIIIDGGTVMATGGGNGSAGIGSGQDGFCGNIIIDGGTVTATGGPGGAGIGSGRYGSCGTITITEGITRVTATKSKSSDKVDIIGKGDNKKTQPSTCGTITISPALIDETVDKTRTLWPGMVLADNADNSTAISNKDGQTTDVQLKGRTLYRDGKWNTLCLPFDVTISGSALDGDNVEAKVFDNTSSLSDAGVLTLKFSAAPATITAGTPFIVKWDNAVVNLVNPVFTGVTISGTAAQEVVSTDGKVKFVGQYSPFDITADNINEILYVASGNKIGYSKSARTLKSCRAHFWVQPNGTSAGARMINLDFGDATGIRPSSVSPEGENTEASTRGGLVGVAYYTLDGRKLSDVPTTKGVYIVNGKKVVIK